MIFRGRVTLSCRRCTSALGRGGEREGEGAIGRPGEGDQGPGGKEVCAVSLESECVCFFIVC